MESIYDGSWVTAWWPMVVFVLGVLVIYYVLLVQAILQMLRSKVNQVLLTFAFLSLVTIPPIFLLGVSVLIIWHFHKKEH